MKAKMIKQVIARKMSQWWATIDNEDLRKLLESNTIVTGGCIASMLLNEKVNDFDVYLRTQSAVRQLADYYVDKFKVQRKAGIECNISVHEEGDRIKIVVKSSGIASDEGTTTPYQYFEQQQDDTKATEYVDEILGSPGTMQDTLEAATEAVNKVKDSTFRPVFLSTNAITLSNALQVVLRFHGEPEDIHKNYDFVHCTNYWSSWDKKLVLHPDALESLLTRELRYVGSKYPLCSLFRLRKFIMRGWSVNAGQILKAAMQLNELDLKDIKVLEDQLVGVDTAYFVEIIEKIKATDPAKINSAYLIEIIDRMF